MTQSRSTRNSFVVAVAFILSFATATYSQDKKKQLPQGTPILWREPNDIASRNLLLGPGGERMKPDVTRVTFVREEKGGYSKKIALKMRADARG